MLTNKLTLQFISIGNIHAKLKIVIFLLLNSVLTT